MMQSKTTFIAISLLLALGLSACDKPGPAEQAGKKMDQAASDTGKKVGETVDKLENKMTEQGAKSAQAFDDTEITAKVKAELLGEPGLKSLQISVDTVKGVVTLTGTVDSKANSDKAKARAMAIGGVRDVTNQLVVTSAK
ncbi:BON domain-containing protein [Dechloromonas sp.]|uniref:BON domain-containing protein n=1 Tax=Dechloromonas sp. TaxID=1917218 RepID=UPI00286E4B78|nr:BON domain-containing protein [Dechloromonas sp.]